MFQKKVAKKALFAILFAMTAFAVTGCSHTAETSDAPAESVVATETETLAEETTETETVAEEETSETETIAEETTEAETTVEETTAPVAGAVLTNAEFLKQINLAFGALTDGTFESDLQAAVDWDIVDENANLQADDAITPEFLISASMRATGLVNGTSSMDEILASAVENNVIASSDISAVDVAQAMEIIEKAKYAWLHPEFKNEASVELADGVINLSEMLSADDVKYNGDSVELPAEYAKDIKEGTVYILPKNENGDGGAYKAQSVQENGATVVITGTPAEVEDVYQSITIN